MAPNRLGEAKLSSDRMAHEKDVMLPKDVKCFSAFAKERYLYTQCPKYQYISISVFVALFSDSDTIGQPRIICV